MNSIKIVALAIIVVSQMYAAATLTNTTVVGSENPLGKDAHGAALYEKELTIETKNFKVDNFWSKFSNNGNGDRQNVYGSIAKTGTVQVSVESASICSLYSELDMNGCSGQKPFLINNEAIAGVNIDDTITLLFQKDFNGTDITYNDSNASVFYPLDILRDEKFYKTEGANSFKSFFARMFDTFFGDSFFSSFFDYKVLDQDAVAAEDTRQRYIANIVSGVDQNHLLVKAETPLATNLLNRPVSLIDYSENSSSAGSCNLFFFKFPQSSTFCNMMGSMPFMFWATSSTDPKNYTVDTIQADTENALVTYAGTYANLNLSTYQDGITYQKQSTSTGLISGMIDMMKCFFFGCEKVNDVQEAMDSYYAFTDDNAINMTFALTNSGVMIDDFETFRLMGIHSLSGNEHTCQVKESNYNDKWSSHTFTGSESDTTEVIVPESTQCVNWLFMMCMEWETTPETTTTVANTYSAENMNETVQSDLAVDTDDDDLMAPSEWLSWCDYMVDKYQDNVVEECTGFFIFRTCKEVPANVKEDGYEVLSYTNSSKKGLLLDLKRVQPRPSDKAVTLRYKLLSTHN